MLLRKLLPCGAETIRRKECLRIEGRTGVLDLIAGSATNSFTLGHWVLWVKCEC